MYVYIAFSYRILTRNSGESISETELSSFPLHEQVMLPNQQATEEGEDPEDMPEPVLSSLSLPGKSIYQPVYHEPRWRIPVAAITFKGYDTDRLALFTHFAVHVASALGIPTSKAYPLPKERRLWTVPKSPFVHKKAQENFERITHSRGVKAWDAHPDIVHLWIQILTAHAMPGVGMRIVKWTRAEIGGGGSELKEVEKKLKDVFKRREERVRQLGEKIVESESAVAEQARMEANVGEKAAETP
jgi:small subunit ribosomal protein S10